MATTRKKRAWETERYLEKDGETRFGWRSWGEGGGGGEATHANGEEVSRMKELCQYPMRHLLQKGAILMTDDDNDEALRDVNDASVRSKIRLK